MPGSTANDQVTEALNQIIQSINDLVGLGGGVVVDTSGIEQAIKELDLCCPPPVIIDGPDGGGTEPPLPEDTPMGPDEPPPPGYAPPSSGVVTEDSQVDTRQCIAANFNHEAIVYVIENLEAYGVANFGPLFVVLIGTMLFRIFALAGFIAPVLVRLISTFGFSTRLVAAIIEGGIGHSYQDLLNNLAANKGDLVCALYEGALTGDAASAKTAYLGILQDGGASPSDLATVSAIMVIDLLASLWYSRSAYEEASLQAYGEGGSGLVNCDTCLVEGAPFTLNYGTLTFGSLSGEAFDILSKVYFPCPRYNVILTSPPDGCYEITWTVDVFEPIDPQACGEETFRFIECGETEFTNSVRIDLTTIEGTVCLAPNTLVQWRNGTQGTISITGVQACE